MPIQKLIATMKGFARKGQHELLKKYFNDDFFEDFIYIKNFNGILYAKLFFKYVNPSFLIDDSVFNI